MYSNKNLPTPKTSYKSFTVQLPGHSDEFPDGHLSNQGDYYCEFKTPLKLDKTKWKCRLRAVYFNNSYSTKIEETEMKILYVIPSINVELIEEVLNFPGSQMLNLVEDTITIVKPLTKLGDEKGPLAKLDAGLYFNAEDLIKDINSVYKQNGVSVNKDLLELREDHVFLHLERAKMEDPWIIPVFDGEVRKRLGLPHILSENMMDIIIQAYSRNLVFEMPLKTAIRINKSKCRSISLYVDCVEPSLPGLKRGEIMRFSGNESLDISDTNEFHFDTPILHPITSSEISMIHVLFKDENDEIVDFPVGQNMVEIEFIKL